VGSPAGSAATFHDRLPAGEPEGSIQVQIPSMVPALPQVLVLAASLCGGGDDEAQLSLEELSLEELLQIPIATVYGASKVSERSLDAPSAVTVIGREEIESQGYRTLADVLRHVRGFVVTDDRNYERVGVRGFALPGDFNGRILLLVDGHRVNEPVFGSAPIGLDFPLDLALVERIEIVRGPGSALYGSNAFFAVIDVITRGGEGEAWHELEGLAGSDEEYGARASVARGGWLLSGSGFSAHGTELFYGEFSGTPSGGTTDTDDEQSGSAFAQLQHGPWRVQGAFVQREKGIPTGSYDVVFDNPDNETLDQRGWLTLEYRGGDEGRSELRGRAAWDHYAYRGTYVYDESGSGGSSEARNRDTTQASWFTLTGEYSRLDLARQHLTCGFELRQEVHVDQENRTGADVFLDDHQQGTVAGVFVQDEVDLGRGLTLSVGLRLDDYSTFGSSLNPRVALVQAHGEYASSKLLFGTAFRPPNAYELHYETPGSQKANTELEPETIRSLEAVHERYSGDRRWRGGVSAYWSRIEDLIVLGVDPLDDLLVHENVGEVTGFGLELEAEHRLDSGASFVLSHAWQRTEDEETGERLVNSPEHLTTLRSEWPLLDDALELGLSAHAMDQRRTLAGETAGFVRFDLALASRRLGHGLEAEFLVANLFDAEYADPVGSELVQDSIEQDGRTLRLTLIWRP